MAHCGAIRRLCWACSAEDDTLDKQGKSSVTKQHCLASCGEDHMVRIYQLR